MAITRSRRSAGSPLGSPQPPQLSHKTNVLRAMHTKKREARLSHRVSVSQISRRRVARCVLITPKTTHNRSQEGVAEELRTTNRLSRVSLKLQRMRPDTALRYLTRKRHITRGNCWLRPGCKARYPEVDLRHTKMDDNPSEKWRHKFKLATLANVARGRATDLLAITRPAGKGKAYDVSHLCHQKNALIPPTWWWKSPA